MPKYTVTDPTTNKSVDLEGDAPPTEQELNDIFGQVHGDQPEQQPAWKTNVSTVARPLLEAGGAVGGGIIGSSLGPIGTAGGGALGFGMGKAGADMLDRSMGIKKPIPSLGGAIKETGQDLQSGAENEAIGMGIGAVAKPLFSGAAPVAKRILGMGTGVPEDAITARFANPEAIKNAAPIQDLTHQLPQTAKALSDQISSADKAAWDKLRTSYNPTEGAMPKDQVVNLINKAKDEVKIYGGGVVGKPAHQAITVLEGIANDIQNIGKHVHGLMNKPGAVSQLLNIAGQEIERTEAVPKNIHLPEATLKGIVQSLDSSINWEDPSAGPVNDVLEKLRTLFDDGLKSGNKEYAKAMEPVSQKLRLLNEIKKRFGVSSVPGQGFQAGTSTESSLSNLFGKNKSVTQDTMGQLDKETGSNFLEDVQNAKHAESFKPGMRAQGSRRTVAGGAIGGAIGHFTGSPSLGAMVGAGTGFTLDTQGGPIAANIIDTIKKYQPNISLTPETIQAIQRAIPSLAKPSKTPDQPTPLNLSGVKQLDDATIAKYMAENNDDPKRAAQAAEAAGYSW